MEVELTPKTEDLLSVIALLTRENDSLRSTLGSCRVSFAQRLFSREDLLRGWSLGPSAAASPSGSIIIKLES